MKRLFLFALVVACLASVVEFVRSTVGSRDKPPTKPPVHAKDLAPLKTLRGSNAWKADQLVQAGIRYSHIDYSCLRMQNVVQIRGRKLPICAIIRYGRPWLVVFDASQHTVKDSTEIYDNLRLIPLSYPTRENPEVPDTCALIKTHGERVYLP